MYRLAHLSDPHVSPLPRAAPWELANKRLLGYLSWHRRRKRVHRPEVLERLTEDLQAQQPDHIVVTGDLVNISLPGEFETALGWLNRLGPAEQVTVIPGNHDAYVALPWARSWQLWCDYMSSEEDAGAARPPQGFTDFPLVRRRGPLALLGTSSALPTAPGLASGRLGAAQLARLERQLRTLGEEGRFRVVLVHHPPVGTARTARKALRDRAGLQAVLAAAGAELVLHGHDHVFAKTALAGAQGAVPVFGVPSASALAHGHKPGAQYLLYEISETADGWRLSVRARDLASDGGSFDDGQRWNINLPRRNLPHRDLSDRPGKTDDHGLWKSAEGETA